MDVFRSRNSTAVHSYAAQWRQAVNPPGAPSGLYILEEWIPETEEAELCKFLGQRPWADHMSAARPTQHFGYKYNRNGTLSTHKKIAGDWGLLETYKARLEKEIPGVVIGQALANMYHQTTGIGAHTDKETDLVFGINIAGDINIVWTRLMMNPATGQAENVKYEACIRRRSLYIMVDEAATVWAHQINGIKSVRYPEYNPQSPQYGQLIHSVKKGENYGRASITFREIVE
tara:strand:+ start:38616 stop:39308 length:693 start_codon:yes stop_codon:yes gene_type:complete